jgi:hypothetical protein
MMGKSGEDIGAIRDLAKERGAKHNPNALVDKIKQELDSKYLGKGTASKQKGVYLKLLEDVKSAANDPAKLADKITELRREVAENKMIMAPGATRDVTRIASKINNDLIKKNLKPMEAELYEDALKKFSASKIFDKMYGFTFGRNYAGRTGPSGVWNTIKDIGGGKIMEKMFTKVGKSMQNTPETFKSPKGFTSEILDAVDSSLDEIIEQMKGEPNQ